MRAALGASRREIVTMVVGQGVLLTAIGVTAGIGVAIAASRALASLLFGISRADPATYAGVVALLFLVAAVAGGIPAWRAARIDPATTLRAE